MGGILTPFICEWASELYPNAPFYLFIGASITGVIACLLLPFETMGMALDSLENKDVIDFDDEIKIESKESKKLMKDL
jgi:hypothetical protein